MTLLLEWLLLLVGVVRVVMVVLAMARVEPGPGVLEVVVSSRLVEVFAAMLKTRQGFESRFQNSLKLQKNCTKSQDLVETQTFSMQFSQSAETLIIDGIGPQESSQKQNIGCVFESVGRNNLHFVKKLNVFYQLPATGPC